MDCVYVWEVNASWITSVLVAPSIDLSSVGNFDSENKDRFAVLFACTDSGWKIHYSDGSTEELLQTGSAFTGTLLELLKFAIPHF